MAKSTTKNASTMGLLGLAIAPGIAICIFIYFKDKYNKEPLGILLLSFIFGAAVIIPAIIIETVVEHQLKISIFSELTSTVIFAYLGVALTEEFCKFVVLRFYSFKRKSFDEPFDGIVYAVMVGMGFATLENIGYVYNNGYVNGIVRMLLSVPAHGTFAVIMGYFIALAKFKPENKAAYIFLSIALPTILHGTFDCFLMAGNTWLHLGGALFSFIIAIALSVIAIRRKQAYSKSYLEAIEKVHKEQDAGA